MNNQKRYRAFGLYIAVILILALLWILKDSSSGFGQNSVYKYNGQTPCHPLKNRG